MLLLENKLIEKIPILIMLKNANQSFIKKKNTKSVKQSEIITYQPDTVENPNIVDIKSVITNTPKNSHNYPRLKKVGSNISLFSDTKKVKIFKTKKNEKKISKRAHVFEGIASTYNVAIFNSLNPKIQLKDTELKIN